VHYSTQYSSLQAAIASNQPQAVAVVAVLLVVQNSSPKNLTALINAMNTTSGPMNSVYPYDLSRPLFSLSLLFLVVQRADDWTWNGTMNGLD